MGRFGEEILAHIRAQKTGATSLVYANAAGEVVPAPGGVLAGVPDLVTLGELAWGTEDMTKVEWRPPLEHEDVMCCPHVGERARVQLAALPRWAKFEGPSGSGINAIGLSRWIAGCSDCWQLARGQAAAVPIAKIVLGRFFTKPTPRADGG